MKKYHKIGIIDKTIRAHCEKTIELICDDGIRDAVMSLRKHKIETFASCEGGVGHSFGRPIVRIHPKHTQAEITKALTKEGYCGFYIKQYYECVDPKQHKLKCSFWEVEFYRTKPKKGIHMPSADMHWPTRVKELKYELYLLKHYFDTKL